MLQLDASLALGFVTAVAESRKRYVNVRVIDVRFKATFLRGEGKVIHVYAERRENGPLWPLMGDWQGVWKGRIYASDLERTRSFENSLPWKVKRRFVKISEEYSVMIAAVELSSRLNLRTSLYCCMQLTLLNMHQTFSLYHELWSSYIINMVSTHPRLSFRVLNNISLVHCAYSWDIILPTRT